MVASKAQLEKAIRDFDQSAQDMAFIGSKPPSEHSYVEAAYKHAKLQLRIMIGIAADTEANHRKLAKLKEESGNYPGPTDEERGG